MSIPIYNREGRRFDPVNSHKRFTGCEPFSVCDLLFLLFRKKSTYFYNINMSTFTNTKLQEDLDTLTVTDSYCSLIVWNDDVNTFEWVIEALMEICGHSQQQAEQCAIIIDSKGKYAVKEGSYEILKPQCDAITERGINATVEVIAN
jgi:ATP-dependent Clp protease adaptor protein ClpS